MSFFLFYVQQHPYLFPVIDVDFVFDHGLVMLIQPFRSGGSLKDVIYGVRWHLLSNTKTRLKCVIKR